MNNYDFLYNKKNKQYVCLSKVNNQTIKVCFTGYFNEYKKNNYWYVYASIYNKRKKDSINYENFVCSGNCGLSGLIEIKNIITYFEIFIKNIYKNENHCMIIYGSNAKRRRIYKLALERIGFSYGMIGGYLQNYKKIS